MQVKQFLEQIEEMGERPLLFEYQPGRFIQGGFHVTEIKNATFETIDCGNSLHKWDEVIVQLWVPEEANADDSHMSAAKFMKIWQVVDGRINLHKEAEIKLEFGDANNLTSIYHVDNITSTANGVKVEMAPPRTMCKPREILVPFTNGATVNVGAVRDRIEQVVPLELTAVGASAASCCSPAQEESTSCC